MDVRRTGIILAPTSARVVIRPFQPANDERVTKIIARILALTEIEVDRLTGEVLRDFRHRHQTTRAYFLRRFEQVRRYLLTDRELTENRRLLIGSYFSQEYAIESAALFNPSMVWHPDQSGLAEGSARFIMSLRATGEGHISSITFRSGVVDAKNLITLDQPNKFTTEPEPVPNSLYEKNLFHRKLVELGNTSVFTEQVLSALGEWFTLDELQTRLGFVEMQNRARLNEFDPTARGMITLARSNYEIIFGADQPISERIIFPSSPSEVSGIEDARFVRFVDDDKSVRYFATYTAYDGKMTLPQLIETDDFLHFKVSTLNGPEVRNKGFALFPRKIGGRYFMLSRQDNENIYIMSSDACHFWYTKQLLARPTQPWEFVQLGNCGSPIETEAGWLVLTHGVGPVRTYCIGAFLLDLNDPTKLIGRLDEPLLSPDASEREGYVPNVVYSCGGALHDRTLIIPYAISDHSSTFATVSLDEVLAKLTKQ